MPLLYTGKTVAFTVTALLTVSQEAVLIVSPNDHRTGFPSNSQHQGVNDE